MTGRKSESEKFAGAMRTYSCEALMQDNRALQNGTSHNLGQNFARQFDLTYASESGTEEFAWNTSWGVSTRMVGGLVMTHGDDQGLVIPPRVAPMQVVIVPIFRNDEERAATVGKAREIEAALPNVRTHIDDRESLSPGAKFYEWERKGVPFRIEIGPKDLAKGQLVLARRLRDEDADRKEFLPEAQVLGSIESRLDEFQQWLLDRARKRARREHPPRSDGLRSLSRHHGWRRWLCVRRLVRRSGVRGQDQGRHQSDHSGDTVRGVSVRAGARTVPCLWRQCGGRGGMGESLLTAATDPFPRRAEELFCEEVRLAAVARRWGTPLYVYSRNGIRDRFLELERALSPLPHLIAYSVKANGNLAVLRTLAECGAGADIVSAGELHRAQLAGIPSDRTVFSGVGKTVEELAAGLRAGIYGFNVESEGELHALSELARSMGATAPIAIRINPDIESPTPHAYTRTGHAATKFGIPIDEARALYRRAATMRGIELRGVDVHIGSQILDVEPYEQALLQALELVRELRADGVRIEYLDIGGGLGISYSGDEGLSAEQFAATMRPHIERAELRLVVEPGRYVVGHAGTLLTRVLYVKQGGGKRFVITDAGMNDLLRPSHYSGFHAVEPVVSRQRPTARVDVVGPICETGDFLALDRDMELPEPGELLAIRTVGAYGFSMSSTYNQRTRPAEVMVDGATAILVRRRETLEELVAHEIDLEGEAKLA